MELIINNYNKKIYDWIINNLINYNDYLCIKEQEVKYCAKSNYKDENNKSNIKKIDNKRYYVLNNESRTLKNKNINILGQETARYIIKKFKNSDINTYDGDKLIITNDTAYKIATRDKILENGKRILISDEIYRIKLEAGLYIDELAKISIKGKKWVKDTKNHSFAKDGFNYRKTYFMSKNGNYYSMNISIGKNKNISTIYNLNKIKETELPQVAQRPDNNAGVAQVSNDKNISHNEN